MGTRLSIALALLSPFAAPAARVAADAVTDIVITEIMYNSASGDRREDFIEIYNRGTVAHNLAGWRFEDGVNFTFPNVTLGAGKFLVVCGDQNRIRQIYGITNTVGNWAAGTTLDRGGERLRLLDQAGLEVEDFTYDDRNPWPILADGYGHSLERRNSDTDNDDPANWSASAVGSSWTLVTATGLATSSTLYVYLTGAGSAWVDDFRLYPVGNQGDNRIQNEGFETGALSPWTASGNHSGSLATVEKAHDGARCLKLVATGAGSATSAAVTQQNLGLTLDTAYTLEFWVFLSNPSQKVVAGLTQAGGQADPILVQSGGGGATPGRVNSVNTNDLPPFVYPAYHLPETPVSSDAVAIQAVVGDDAGVTEVTAHWDSGTGERTARMFDDGAHADGAAGDGVWGVGIGSFSTGRIVRYYVTATDSAEQTGRYPFPGNPTTVLGFYVEPPGINPGFQARSNTGLTSSRPPVYHLLLSSGALSQLDSDPDSYVEGTFIYNGEVFENVRIRHRGQTSLNTPKRHWKVDFNKDHRFLTPFDDHPEVDNINLQSCYGDKSFLREWLSYQAWMKSGQPALEMWHVRVYLNGAYRGLYVHLENPNGDWLQRSDLDPEGWLWKSYSQARGGTGGFEMKEDGGDPVAAQNELSDFIANMNSLTGTGLDDYILDNMNVQSFTDFLANIQLIHNCDHPAKNYLVYADEGAPAGSWTYYLWDGDLTHGRNYECSGGGVFNDTMRHDMFGDPQLLFGTSARPKCDGPWNGVINGFLYRTQTFRELYYVRVAELLEEFYHPDVLNPLIDDMAAPLLPEIEMDWNRNPPQYGTRSTAAFHSSQLKGWVQKRYDYLTGALARLTAPDLTSLSCTRNGNQINLFWINQDDGYDAVRVYRDGARILELQGAETSAVAALDLTKPLNTFRVASVYQNVERPGESCTIILSNGDYTTVINQDFSPPASTAELAVNCAALQTNGVLQLTPPTATQAGTAFFRTRYPVDDFIADFDLRFDEPSSPGADGLVFAMIRGNDPTLCGAPGGALGFWQGDAGGVVMNGYGVVFDTWQNPGEPSHNWAGFIDTARQASGAFSAVNVPEEFTGNGAFHVRVTGKNGTFTVVMGNQSLGMAPRQLFSYTVPGFVGGDMLFGFTAGTGGAVSRHVVDNFVLQVSGPPAPVVAGFHADLTAGDAPFTVSFVNDSTGATGYSWSFGDGTGSLQANPQHTYQAPGVYTVSLTASGPGGNSVLAKPDYITAEVLLEADFRADKTVGPKGMVVRFTDLSQSNVGTPGYAWNFGDGGTSTLRNTTHIYNQPGQFTVSLKITGPGGISSTKTQPNYIQVDDALVADFSADPVRGPAPLRVGFSDASSGLTIRSWNWTFGDGASATIQNPSHIYSAPGTYTVKLVISGYQAVQSMEKTAYIIVDATGQQFLRGDGNTDGAVDISDAIAVLGFLFTGGSESPCRDAMDANDDGGVDISDSIAILDFLFRGGASIPAPFPGPGADPTADGLPACSG